MNIRPYRQIERRNSRKIKVGNVFVGGEAHITVNKNSVPNDPQSPFVTSGIRLGTAAITTRGFKEAETVILGNLICDVLDDIENESNINAIKEKVLNLTSQFPVYATNKKAVA